MHPPYATEARPDTGLYNAKLGLWLFLAAEAMFFGALFSSYAFLRTASEVWPVGARVLPVEPALLTTSAALLAATSTARAWLRVKRGNQLPRMWLGWVAVFGFAMAALVCHSMGMETAQGMSPASSTFYACWFLFTGLIAAHAAAGALYALYLQWPSTQGEARLILSNRIECLGLYFHFVALVWLAAFGCFYGT